MSEEEKAYNELEENYEKIVEMLSNGNFLQLNGKAINLAELNEYINAQQKEIERLNNIIKEVREYIELGINFDSLGVARTKRKLLEILDKENNND